MKTQDEKTIQEGQEALAALKAIRGNVFGMHNRIANDPRLLRAFTDIYSCANTEAKAIPEKYRELIIMAIAAAKNIKPTLEVHSKKAIAAGATVEEMGELMRILLLTCGVTSIIPASEVFEEILEAE